MKEHLINKKAENKTVLYIHRIILAILFLIFLYEFVLIYKADKFYFLSYEQINLFLNILYYLLCVVNEFNKKETKKLYHHYFHLCFSLSSSIPILYLVIYFLYNNEDAKEDKSIVYILFLIFPIISNILETLIIKRYKPDYINPIFIILFLVSYYALLHYLGKMEMDIGDFESKSLIEVKFIMLLFIISLIGAFVGWWLYKSITKPKIKKINLDSSVNSNELSDE